MIAETRFDENIWWVQDGAPCHRLRVVTDRLRELFGHQVVTLNREVEWPQRSPELTPSDFFLWGYLNQRVYVRPPTDIITLRQKITEEFNAIKNNPAMVQRVIGAFQNRARLCIERNGGHVERHYA